MTTHFEIQEDIPDHAYRTEIPNIVFHLGLDPYEFLVYSQIKNIAWDRRFCCKSYKDLANLLKVSERKIILAVHKLEAPFEKLGGKSLIKVDRDRKDSKGGNLPNLLTVTNIWRINGEYFRKDQEISKVVHEVQGGGACDAPGGVHMVHPDKDNIEKITHTHTRTRERDPPFSIPKKNHELDANGLPVINLKDQEHERLIANTIQLHSKSREEAKCIVDDVIRQYRLTCGSNGHEHEKPYYAILKWIDKAVKDENVRKKNQCTRDKQVRPKWLDEPEIYKAKTVRDLPIEELRKIASEDEIRELLGYGTN